MKKIDFKKELGRLYKASAKKSEIVDVPRMNFIMIDGKGDPNNTRAFQESVEALFGLSYTLKFMIRKSERQIDYGVMPLEGLWWADDMAVFKANQKDEWKWTVMIMQPDCVTKQLFEEARQEVSKKKGIPASAGTRFKSYREGRSAQIMHVGPFEEEGPTIEKLHGFIHESGHVLRGKHHEIYLSDIRRAAPDRWKTIIRQPFGQG